MGVHCPRMLVGARFCRCPYYEFVSERKDQNMEMKKGLLLLSLLLFAVSPVMNAVPSQ